MAACCPAIASTDSTGEREEDLGNCYSTTTSREFSGACVCACWGPCPALVPLLETRLRQDCTCQGSHITVLPTLVLLLDHMHHLQERTHHTYITSSRALPIAQPHRFIVAFSLVSFLGAFITAGPLHGLSSGRSFWIGMFTINTLLFMIASEATWAA